MAPKKRRTRSSKNFSYVLYIFYILVLLIVIGSIIGSTMFMRLGEDARNLLLSYAFDSAEAYSSDSWSFNQLFFRQFMYHGSIWVLGLTVIGVVINLFLVFLRGVVAGVNVIFLFSNLGMQAGFWAGMLWVIQYFLVMAVTVLSAYFSIRFVILSGKILLVKKRPELFKQHLLIYFYQLVIVMVLTLFTSGVTFVVQPLVFRQVQRVSLNVQDSNLPSRGDFLVIDTNID